LPDFLVSDKNLTDIRKVVAAADEHRRLYVEDRSVYVKKALSGVRNAAVVTAILLIIVLWLIQHTALLNNFGKSGASRQKSE